MIRIISTFFFICLAINKAVFADSACNNPVFGLSGIAIDRQAGTANEAQIASMADAHQRALQIVLDRLLLEPAPVGLVSSPESVVELVHIRTETSLPGRYIAEIDICFVPEALRRVFSANDLAWAEVASPPILVLPVFSDGAGIRAWQAGHPWLSGWRDDASARHSLISYQILAPSLVNERQLRAEKLIDADKEALQKAAARAKAEQVLLTRAIVSFIDDAPQISMQAILYDKSGKMIAPIAKQIITDEALAGDSRNLTSFSEAFRQESLSRIEASWQKVNLRRVGLSNKLNARISFADHASWVALHRALSDLPVINDIETRLIRALPQGDASSEAVVTLKMNGSIEALRYGLAPMGLSLRMEEGLAVIEKEAGTDKEAGS